MSYFQIFRPKKLIFSIKIFIFLHISQKSSTFAAAKVEKDEETRAVDNKNH